MIMPEMRKKERTEEKQCINNRSIKPPARLIDLLRKLVVDALYYGRRTSLQKISAATPAVLRLGESSNGYDVSFNANLHPVHLHLQVGIKTILT